MWKAIDGIIMKTILAAEPELTHSVYTSTNYRTNCSELFGFDIFIDSHLKPHLIEVSSTPTVGEKDVTVCQVRLLI